MSIRVDTASLIAGSIVCGNRGLGLTGSTILAETSVGDSGVGYLADDIDSGDENKEFMGLVTTYPSAGNFFPFENGSFIFSGAPNGTYSFVYELKVDGVSQGNATVTLVVGLARVTKDFNYVFNVRNTIAKDNIYSFGIRKLVQNDSQFNYQIRLVTGSSTTILYDILSGLSTTVSSYAINYKIRSIVNADYGFTYSILRTVQSDVHLDYFIRVKTASDNELFFKIRTLTGSSINSNYDIRTKVSSDVVVEYLLNGRNVIQKDYVILYNILREIPSKAVVISIEELSPIEIFLDE